jgi:TPR repeat protein
MQSQCSLGVHDINGDGVTRDATAGANLYKKSAEQGDEWACYLLGLCYRDGTGVKRNRRLAGYWFSKAASKGVADAKKELERVESRTKNA